MSVNYNYQYIFKFIIIGDMGSGKSSVLRQFTEKIFSEKTGHTIGVEFGTRIIDINDTRIKLQIWDTAGQERFRSVTQSYYRASIGTILVYDITNKESFTSIERWLNDARDLTAQNCVFALIGNKADSTRVREVTYDEGKQFADEQNILFYETSAKTGNHIEDVFLDVTSKILELIKNDRINPDLFNSGVQSRIKSDKQGSNPNVNPGNSKEGGYISRCC